MGLVVLPENATEAQSVRGGRQQFTSTQPDEWVRPADWLAMPSVVASDKKFVGLLAIRNNDSNFVSLLARGAYTVDWGDGTVENFADNVQASHQYTYSSIPASTASSRGYRQVLVTVTPQAGATFTVINIKKAHPTVVHAHNVPWLDIVVAGSTLTTVTTGTVSTTIYLYDTERVRILSSAVTTWAYQFEDMVNLRSVFVASSEAATSIANMFYRCRSLRTLPAFTTSAATNWTYAFAYSGLEKVPALDASAATTLKFAFGYCDQLREVGTVTTTSALTIAEGMFYGCSGLEVAPLLTDTSALTDPTTMFYDARALRSVPAYDFSAAASGNTASIFGFNNSIAESGITGLRYSHDYSPGLMSASALETMFGNLGIAATSAQIIGIGSNPGADGPASLSGTTTAGSTTVTMASTTGLSTGMEISGPGISTNAAVTIQDSGDTITRTAHGLLDGGTVSLASIDQTTGASTFTPYYVVNKTANTFQIADTAGGSAKALTVTPATSVTGVTSNGSSTDATTYTGATITLTAGRLYLLCIENSHGTSATAVSSITGSGSSVPTFTSRGTTLFNSNLNRVSIWSAVPKTNYSGTLTANFSGVTQTGAIYQVIEVKGVDTSTNDGIVQSATNTGNDGTATVNLSALADANNRTFGAQGHATATASAPGGTYVEIYDSTQSTPAQALQTLSLSPGSTTVSATFTSAQWGIVALELKQASDGVGSILYPTTISSIVTNTSVTMSSPASTSGTVTTSSGNLKRSKARMRNWTVSG